jgi:hypothetical protein
MASKKAILFYAINNDYHKLRSELVKSRGFEFMLNLDRYIIKTFVKNKSHDIIDGSYFASQLENTMLFYISTTTNKNDNSILLAYLELVVNNASDYFIGLHPLQRVRVGGQALGLQATDNKKSIVSSDNLDFSVKRSRGFKYDR